MEEKKTELKMIKMSEVQSQEIEWLWYPFIPYGKLTIVQGDPGDGKTTLILNIAAKLSKGEGLDNDMKLMESMNIIYQTAEDGLADTVKPRLEKAGADCERILIIDESDKSLSMADERLEEAIIQTGARMLILDPIQAYLGGGMDMNPCKKVDKMGRPNAKELNFWTKDEYEQFIQCFSPDEGMYQIIFQMLFWLGCRVGELLALTSEDIDFENGTVNISKTYYRRNQTDYITPPKTESSNRKITIPKFLVEEMKDFVDKQYGLTLEDRIFPITDRAIQKKMKQKTEQAKLKPIRVHDLRQSHIALLIEKGMQPLVIAQRVGHDSVNTTMNIYGHLYPNKQKQVADMLNAEATGEPESKLVDMATEMRYRKAGGWS